MRRGLTGVVAILFLCLAGAADAAPPVPAVSGGYTYSPWDAVHTRVALSARGGERPTGWLDARNELVGFGGPVLCVMVDGDDAWVAGSMAYVAYGDTLDTDAWIVRVTDGAKPGSEIDYAATFMEFHDAAIAFCESADRSAEDYMTPVLTGNVLVRP